MRILVHLIPDFYTFLIISLMLFSANIFVLSQFFGSISGLGQPIFGGMSDFHFYNILIWLPLL